MVRELIERRRPALGYSGVANREHAARDGLDEKDPPAVWRIWRWVAGNRAAPRNPISPVRPGLAWPRDCPGVTLCRITDGPPRAWHPRRLWVTRTRTGRA